jgi:hypothetical protein
LKVNFSFSFFLGKNRGQSIFKDSNDIVQISKIQRKEKKKIRNQTTIQKKNINIVNAFLEEIISWHKIMN